MNEIIKAMLERRSIRKFKSDMVPKKDIDETIYYISEQLCNKQAASV